MKYDLAIRWNSDAKTLRRLDNIGGVPLHGYPWHLKVPGGRVFVVLPGGEVARTFRVARISGPRSVLLASGDRKLNGYVAVAFNGSIQRPSASQPQTIHIRWHAVGQFRYVKGGSGLAVFISKPGREVPDEPLDHLPERREASWHPYTRGIPGLPKGHPESRLVDAYIEWIGQKERFAQRIDRATRQWIDLFDRTAWRLIEAKANVDRRTIRTAIGQLFDYKQGFRKRRPSLGVLLPAFPGRSALTFINSCGCTAIWMTETGQFRDSSGTRAWSLRLNH